MWTPNASGIASHCEVANVNGTQDNFPSKLLHVQQQIDKQQFSWPFALVQSGLHIFKSVEGTVKKVKHK